MDAHSFARWHGYLRPVPASDTAGDPSRIYKYIGGANLGAGMRGTRGFSAQKIGIS